MSKRVIMKCGHATNATMNNKPVCAICYGLNDGADIVDTAKTNLNGRIARCCYCKHQTLSDTSLPFFRHTPNNEYDEYYCGCRGWD
jgi:hypothetical protein